MGFARARFTARRGRGMVELAPRESREGHHERHSARQPHERGVDAGHSDASEGENAKEEQGQEGAVSDSHATPPHEVGMPRRVGERRAGR